MSLNNKSLVELIHHYFNEEEIRKLVFDLNFDFEDLPASFGKFGKVQILVKTFEENDRIPELIGVARRHRPHVNWPDTNHQYSQIELYGLPAKFPLSGELTKEVISTELLNSSELLREEWAVAEASNAQFLGKVRKLYEILKGMRENADSEIVITIYAKSFEDEIGVGKFEYDLLYCRNVIDHSPMYGPIVADDDRTKFTNDPSIKQEISKIDPKNSKKGGFVDREKIRSAAKFKLGADLWGTANDEQDVKPHEITGLLFINGRNRSIFAKIFKEEKFRESIKAIEKEVNKIKVSRYKKFKERRGLLVGKLFSNKNNKARISSHNPAIFFEAITDIFQELTDCPEVAFTVFGYDQRKGQNRQNKGRLIWLWSNGPTSANAILPIRPKSLLLFDVVNDANHKPLLIHNLQDHQEFQNRVIRTKLGDKAQSNLIVPILTYSDDAYDSGRNQLLGIIDLQWDEPIQIDTDDIQLIYLLTQLVISGYMANFFGEKSNERYLIPLYKKEPYHPFQPKNLDFSIRELVELNFNPMKLFLHWETVKELITTGVTSAPSSVEIWPNMVCNHKCAWCRTEQERRTQRVHKQMSEIELLGIARDLKESFSRVDILISGGGEPLLHPNITEFIKEIKSVRGILGIFTNGTRPNDPKFWEHFFDSDREHSFVRVSFNGHDTESYYRIHFNSENEESLPLDYQNPYAEARKTILDILAMRSARCSIAIGDTIQDYQRASIKMKAEHASNLGVDFIQMRPELWESSHENSIGDAVCRDVKEVAKLYKNRGDFAVIQTDGERSFVNHDEDTCYAMNLVPTLVPDKEKGWIRVMPCSYAINIWGTAPDLGRIREGEKLSDFWQAMNKKLTGDVVSDNNNFEIRIDRPIVPKEGCPQCRYYRLNKRIQAIKDKIDHIDLIDQLISEIKVNPDKPSPEIVKQVEMIWGKDVIDIPQLVKAMELSKKLEIISSF